MLVGEMFRKGLSLKGFFVMFPLRECEGRLAMIDPETWGNSRICFMKSTIVDMKILLGQPHNMTRRDENPLAFNWVG